MEESTAENVTRPEKKIKIQGNIGILNKS